MSARSEQRSDVEDWRAAASEKESEPKGRFPWLIALVALFAAIGIAGWLLAH